MLRWTWCWGIVLAGSLLTAGPVGAEEPKNPAAGREKLNEAIDQKLTAESLSELAKVIELSREALELGLDTDDTAFAKQLLSSALIQRGSFMGESLLQGSDKISTPREFRQWRAMALGDLNEAVEQDANQPQAWLLIGRLEAIAGGDHDRALEAVNKALELAQEDNLLRAKALAARAALTADPEKQLADYNQALELAPEEVEVVRARGLFLAEQGRAEEALPDLKKAVELNPADAVNQIALGGLLADQRKFDEAIAAFDKAVELQPSSPQLYLQRARLQLLRGKSREAVTDLDKLLELAPEQPMALLLRATAKHQLGEHDAALADVELILRERSDFAPALRLRGLLLADVGKLKEAVTVLRQAVDIEPDDQETRLQLAMVEMASKDANAAIADFTLVVESKGDNWIALQGRADAYLSLGKQPEALADYERAHKLQPDSSTILNNLAWLLSTSPDDKLRDGRRAIELATQACKLTEFKQAHILSTLAASYAETGDYSHAIEWSTKAVELGDARQKVALAKELESYKAKKPWRELIAEPLPETPSATEDENRPPSPDAPTPPGSEPGSQQP